MIIMMDLLLISSRRSVHFAVQEQTPAPLSLITYNKGSSVTF